jgi:hypothetical protein
MVSVMLSMWATKNVFKTGVKTYIFTFYNKFILCYEV